MDISDVDIVSRWRRALLGWATRPAKPDQEPWRRLAMRLRPDLGSAESRSLMLVAPGEGEIEARCSLELAEGLADELGKPVLLVDAAPRERRLSRLLQCSELRGLTDALVEPELALGEIVLRTSHPNVAIVPAGIIAEAAGHVAADRVAALLEAFQRDHEVVLFSGGAVPPNGLALALAPLVGRVLLLAAENETTSEDFEAAQESLRVRNARDVGVILATRSAGS